MTFLYSLWAKITPTKSLETAGPIELAFFEQVYRLSFLTALSKNDESIQYRVYWISVRVISLTVLLCEFWHVLSDKLSIDEIISSMNVIFIHMLTLWKHMMMTNNEEVFENLKRGLESPSFDVSTDNRKKIVKNWSETHEKYFKLFLTWSCVTLAVWYTFPLVDQVEYNLMLDIKVPIQYDSPSTYPLTYLVVGLMFHFTSFMVVMAEIIMHVHLIVLICQFDVLADCFENVFDECAVGFEDVDIQELVKKDVFVEKYVTRLGDLVTQHNVILSLTQDLKKVLSFPMLGHLACSGLLICFVGYQAITTMSENLGKFLTTLLYLGYNMFNLYLICRWCQEITSQSKRIGEAAYFSGWENGMSIAPGVRASILMVIARADTPLVFLAGGMYPLSLSSYTNLVKASYSALNILLTMSP